MTDPADPKFNYHRHHMAVATQDVREVLAKDLSYDASWKARGGVGAFMMLARKWDRLEPMTEKEGYDIFRLIESQSGDMQGTDGTAIAEIRDLRRYLLNVECEMIERGWVMPPPVPESTHHYGDDLSPDQSLMAIEMAAQKGFGKRELPLEDLRPGDPVYVKGDVRKGRVIEFVEAGRPVERLYTVAYNSSLGGPQTRTGVPHLDVVYAREGRPVPDSFLTSEETVGTGIRPGTPEDGGHHATECPACGGRGWTKTVTASGNTESEECPNCRGTGRRAR